MPEYHIMASFLGIFPSQLKSAVETSGRTSVCPPGRYGYRRFSLGFGGFSGWPAAGTIADALKTGLNLFYFQTSRFFFPKK
jgi:hypothetical protein